MAASEEGNVSVVVRVRPPNQREQEGHQQRVVQVVDHSMLVFDPEEPDPVGVFAGLRGHDAPRRKGKDLKFVFDRVFSEGSQQQEVFQHTTRDILDGVLNGYNCSVFAYGATGAGKTHTMLGSEGDPGVMFLTMVELYRRIEALKEKRCEVLISYLEVYNEQIQDLLEPKGSLAIREDPQKGVVVQGLSLHQPKSAEQLLQMLANGNKNRTQHPTDANATSSRSHAVFQIYVKQHDRVASINQDLRVAKMSLIDLAGSERASSTNAKGDRQREGANINRSLLALINVINALADAKSKKPHIPYRDSKLTRLLKDSIGGNCRTVMIAAISPSPLSYDDTYNTLKYANRAKEIKLSLKSNVISLDCHISKYAAVCEELKAQVAELRQRLHSYEQDDVGAAPQDKEPAGAVEGEADPQEGETRSRLEEPPQEAGVAQEAACKDLQQAGSRMREFNIRTMARRQDQERDKLSCEDPPPSPKYRRILRPRKAALGRRAQQERPLSEHQTQDYDRMGRLVSALLRLARNQQSILKAADLQTPEVMAEFEELEQLVQMEEGALWGVKGTGQPPEKRNPSPGQLPKKNDQSSLVVPMDSHHVRQSLAKKALCLRQPIGKMDQCLGQPAERMDQCLGQPAEKMDQCLGQPAEKMDQCLGQPAEKMDQCLGQPAEKMDQCLGQPAEKRDQCLGQPPKKRVREVSLTMAIEMVPALRTRLSTAKAKLLDCKQAMEPTAQERPVLKRARRELVPDCSPTLQSPIVPVKKRRRCEGSSPSKAGTAASTPEDRAKRQRKSFLPGPGRGSLNKGVTVLPQSRPSSSTPLILPDTPPKKTPLCTPKPASGGTPKPCPSTAPKGRLPLATSAIQNCAPAQRPPLPTLTARDLNTTFDLSEDGWLASDLDRTVTFGPSTFPGWENVGCSLRQANGTLAPRPEVAVFTMKGPSVTRSSAPPPSTIKKPGVQRRRRSVSITTSRSMGGPYSQSRIARLHSSTVKKPPTVAERTSCSPSWQSDRKTRKGAVAFGRTVHGAPASRSLQFAAGK